ncbi:CapA family protein [Natrinema halophilum]|uniref:CapA family protein n=1 Tax=Natrinema halophilum TaxID=1699371 RepID=UPI001F1A2DC9|nr:CapA family protein [Natrinema halophilum]UHQ96310.1 CapA family protein [Natrinema halophilum]
MAIQQRDQFVLAATGDAIPTREILPYEGVTDRFDQMLSLLRETDATVANFEEMVRPDDGYPNAQSSGLHIGVSPEMIDELTAMGCDIFSTASNHTMDFGHAGIEHTIAEFRSRDVPFAGMGRTLFEAQKPAYLETAAGRVALVNSCSTVIPGSEAGEQTAAMPGRPGMNPLHVEQIYKATAERIEALEKISEEVGIENLKEIWHDSAIQAGHDWDQEEFFHFMDLKFESVDEVSECGIEYRANQADESRITDWIEEARNNADWVLMAHHGHEGVDGLGGTNATKETPRFMTEFAKNCIDAGADAFIGTGPHVIRGIELYQDCPIFYSLGNFIIQFDTLDRLGPVTYDMFGIDQYSKASVAYDAWGFDEDGSPQAYVANDGWFESFIPVCRFDGSGDLEEIELHPLDLQQRQSRPQRGIPVLADEEKSTRILEDVASLSADFGTEVVYEDGVGRVEIQ